MALLLAGAVGELRQGAEVAELTHRGSHLEAAVVQAHGSLGVATAAIRHHHIKGSLTRAGKCLIGSEGERTIAIAGHFAALGLGVAGHAHLVLVHIVTKAVQDTARHGGSGSLHQVVLVENLRGVVIIQRSHGGSRYRLFENVNLVQRGVVRVNGVELARQLALGGGARGYFLTILIQHHPARGGIAREDDMVPVRILDCNGRLHHNVALQAQAHLALVIHRAPQGRVVRTDDTTLIRLSAQAGPVRESHRITEARQRLLCAERAASRNTGMLATGNPGSIISLLLCIQHQRFALACQLCGATGIAYIRHRHVVPITTLIEAPMSPQRCKITILRRSNRAAAHGQRCHDRTNR